MSYGATWRGEDVLRIVRGESLHEQSWEAQGVAIDKNAVARGNLFVAVGPNGHDQVAAAFAAGAVAALVSRQPLQASPGAPLIFVENTTAALRALAQAGRARLRGKMIAVTGTVGKSSVREMLRLSLAATGDVAASTDHADAELGALLALASLPPGADYAIVELGLRRPGEMAELASLTRPDIALVTAIEPMQLDAFASIEAIADTAAEIFQGMNENGAAILHRDAPLYGRLAAAAKNRGLKKILSFGFDAKADARLVDCAVTREGCAVNAMIMGYNTHYSVGSPGTHIVRNSLAALLAATVASRAVDASAAALAHYHASRGRGGIVPLTLAVGGILTVIDESAGACPASVRAALGVLSQTIPTAAGRRILALGDIGGLGAASAALHADLAPAIADSRVDSVFCCGEMMLHLFHALPDMLRGGYAPDSAALAAQIALAVRADDIVTVKGGREMNMNAVIDALKALDVTQPRKIAS